MQCTRGCNNCSLRHYVHRGWTYTIFIQYIRAIFSSAIYSSTAIDCVLLDEAETMTHVLNVLQNGFHCSVVPSGDTPGAAAGLSDDLSRNWSGCTYQGH